jgi:alkylation response protein AidB-like acyl-CoA dehydrogenase
MNRLTDTAGLTEEQLEILAAVHEFAGREILPVAGELDRSDTYPDRIVAGLRELGVFGLPRQRGRPRLRGGAARLRARDQLRAAAATAHPRRVRLLH